MDPNVTLHEARAMALEVSDSADNGEQISPEHARLLAAAFLAMDEWLSNGGFLPVHWQGIRSAGLIKNGVVSIVETA